jgi:hypothetical protein
MQSIRCDVFRCKNQPQCGISLRLPVDRLSSLLVHSSDPSTPATAVALICPYCQHIDTYSIQADSLGPVDADRDQTQAIERMTWLRCGEQTCELYLPLIGMWGQAFAPAREAEQRMSNMAVLERAVDEGRSNLHCLMGHPIPLPQTR